MCLPKGRWTIDTTLCSSYTVPTATSLYLQCAASSCVGPAPTGKTLNPPCHLDSSPLNNRFNVASCLNTPSTDNLGGFVVKIDGQTNGACILTNIIQNCLTYAAVSAQGANTRECKACDSGYTLVDTDQSKPTSSSTSDVNKKVCIPDAKLDPNNLCDAYSNVDFTCFRCKNGLTYDKVLKRCPTPTDATSDCDTAFTSGGKTICLSCKSGYTLIYPVSSAPGVCVESVEKCALLSVSGCSRCVNGYQLVDEECI